MRTLPGLHLSRRVLGNTCPVPCSVTIGAAGFVLSPGRMTGQVLSGTNPRAPAAYQVVTLPLMVSETTAIGAAVAVIGGHRQSFGPEEFFLLKAARDGPACARPPATWRCGNSF